MTEMISFGAGVNSVAMTIMLVNDGWQGPIVFADPGAEHPDTYCYIDYFEREWLKPRGLEVTRISPALTPDLYPPSYRHSLIEKCQIRDIVPLMMSRWCTIEYKRKPLTKWAKEHGITGQNIGIALEESHRARFIEHDGIFVNYPLVDRKIARAQCKDIIRAEALSVPPKSGCFICPFQRVSEWRALYDLRPDLFQLATDLDNAAIDKMKEARANPFEGQLTYKFGHPLQWFKDQWDAQLELPLMPDPEYEYQMCECRL